MSGDSAQDLSCLVGFIGCGAIAEVLSSGLVGSGLIKPGSIIASDVSPERLEQVSSRLGIATTSDNLRVLAASPTVIVAVKPQVIETVLTQIRDHVRPDQVLVSCAAGVTLAYLQSFFRRGTQIIRIMPNTPCMVGEGVIALTAGRYAAPENVESVRKLFSGLGAVVVVPENLMDAVTGLSGSGPAFVYVVVEALADAGVRVGFQRETALLLAAQTVLGSAKMVIATGEHPGRLRDRVASPGGTAIAGIHALEQSGLRAALMNAVVAATDRSRELGVKRAETTGAQAPGAAAAIGGAGGSGSGGGPGGGAGGGGGEG